MNNSKASQRLFYTCIFFLFIPPRSAAIIVYAAAERSECLRDNRAGKWRETIRVIVTYYERSPVE